MAMGKNKTGIMAAITAASEAPATRAERTLPRGTIGSVRAGLGGIQEIDPEQILPWGPADRLDPELTAVNSGTVPESIVELAESIKTSGQQVPVLLRPAPQDGKFEVVYGRRRILACRALGQPVRALVRTLDDTEALRAKGLENASRTDLSFYERARFAEGILSQGYSRGDVMEALAISKNSLSQLERITRLIPTTVGDAIGAAPGAGRPKWMALAAAFEKGGLSEVRALGAADGAGDSDARFDAVLAEASRRGPSARAASRTVSPGVTLKSGGSSVTLTVARKKTPKGFAEWLEHNLDDVIQESFARFREENPERQGS